MDKQERHMDIRLLTRFLAGECTTEEQLAVNDWIERSDKNRQEFTELEKAWKAMDKTSARQEINLDLEWDYITSRIDIAESPERKFTVMPLLRIAAVMVLSFGLAFAGITYFTQKTIRTKLDETTEISLPDGSKVTLNAGSRLKYKTHYGKGERVVSLQGEAFFEVRKNAGSPFIIKLNDAQIQVLGTSFNVKAYRGMQNIEVTVAEGKVSVYDKKQPLKKVVTVAGEKAEFNRQQKAVKKTENTDRNFISWKTRRIVFENDDLQQIVNTLSDVYHRSIILRNPALKECTLTTSFDNETLETVFNILESTLEITIEEEGNVIYISGSGC
jgi:transmembrane sensor